MWDEKSISVCFSPGTRIWFHLEKNRGKIKPWCEIQKAKLFNVELVDMSKAYMSPLLYITLNRGRKNGGERKGCGMRLERNV